MGQSHYPPYQASHGSMAPMLWYESLPDHVRRLYDYKSTFSQQPPLMVVLAEVVCEASTVWALEELFKSKRETNLWEALSAGKKSDASRIFAINMLIRFTQLPQGIK